MSVGRKGRPILHCTCKPVKPTQKQSGLDLEVPLELFSELMSSSLSLSFFPPPTLMCLAWQDPRGGIFIYFPLYHLPTQPKLGSSSLVSASSKENKRRESDL